MSSPNLPPCPSQLKTVQHYLKIANDYDKREPIVAYWTRLYALQQSLKLDRKSPEARALLTALMDYLETFKKTHADNDAVTSDVAGQALVENVVHKLFTWADSEDRQSRFNKNVVKVFYSAGLLCDVCEVFGELSEEVASQRKYAKWKATYIHNCLKNGETPIPGPMGGDDEGLGEDEGGEEGAVGGVGWTQPSHPGMSLPSVPGTAGAGGMPTVSSSTPPPASFPPPSVPHNLPQMPHGQPAPAPVNIPHMPVAQTSSIGATVDPEAMGKAQKYCKWAASALDYDDAKTAINNLQKALSLLTTGQES